MPAAALLRDQLEAVLAHKIPGALSPKPQIAREFLPTGVHSVDELLQGGFPANAITEIVGEECSGRTSLALSLVAGLTQAGKVCAWVDVSDALQPESAAASGVDLQRLLWVRCGVAPALKNLPPVPRASILHEFNSARSATVPEKYFIPRPVAKGLHGGGFGPHPRGEVKGLSNAIAGLLKEGSDAPRAGLPRKTTPAKKNQECSEVSKSSLHRSVCMPKKPWSRLDQALRATDLFLQNGGFAAIVLDMGSIAPAHALRVPLATWFRYRAVAEQKQTSVVLLLQHPCAKSSAALTLRLHTGNPRSESTIFAGLDFFAEVERQRFSPNSEDIVELRKPSQKQRWTQWQSRTAWAGR
jgi:recombination protein RecA